MSLRTKVMAIALGLALLIGFGATVEMRRSLTVRLDEEMEVGVVGVARTIASSLATRTAAPTEASLRPILWRVHRVNPDVRYVVVVSADGHRIADTLPFHLRPLVRFPAADSPRQPFQVRRFRAQREFIREVSLPVEGGWGTVQVGVSEARMHELVEGATTRFLTVLLVIALVGVALAALLTHRVTAPIMRLAEVARAVEHGDRGRRAPARAGDEVGRLGEAFNAMLDSLQEALRHNEALLGELHEQEQARVELLRQLLSAQEDERRRIARELHDETAQLVASLLAGLSTLEASVDARDRQPIQELLTLTEQTMTSLRQVALRLRPDALERYGLEAALRQRVDEFAQRHHLKAQVETVGLEAPALPEEVETALYRIVNEAVTNVARHANAEHLSVVVERRGAQVLAVVEDDGCGFAADEVQTRPIKQRLGLFGMRERAELVGGSLRVESQPGAGTTLQVRIPCA